MSFIDLAEKVENCAIDYTNWSKVREEIISRHASSTAVDEYITLLSLHSMLMDNIQSQLSDGIAIEEFKALKRKDYKMLLKREYIIGGSVCVDTLYELTQRELEAGRMGPEDELINLSVNAIAEPHYSREQLLRQEEKINKVDNSSALPKILHEKLREKFSRMFK